MSTICTAVQFVATHQNAPQILVPRFTNHRSDKTHVVVQQTCWMYSQWSGRNTCRFETNGEQSGGVSSTLRNNDTIILTCQLHQWDYGLISYHIAPTTFQTMSQMCNHSATMFLGLFASHRPFITLVGNKTTRNQGFHRFPECCHTSGVPLWPIREVSHVYDHKTTVI